MNLMYCDSHTHLLDEAFDTDRDTVIVQAINAGVKYIAEIGCEPGYWEKALILKEKYSKNIYTALGLHPHDCDKSTPENLKKLKNLCRRNNVSAIGEIGLDYAKSTHSRETQAETFITLLKETALPNKPVILHCRNGLDKNAYEDLFALLKKYHKQPEGRRFAGILHCFGGSYDDAKKATDMGFLLGINATITYPKNENLREIIRKIGVKNLITETDCPYLPPQSQRGKRNSPSNIPEICKALSEVTKTPLIKTAEKALENFQVVF